MTPTCLTLQQKPEPELAAYQVLQVGNTCTFHAIAVALDLLVNHPLDPQALSEEADRLWWRGRLLRVAPSWAVTPRMQVRMVKYLAEKHYLPISATYRRGKPETLPEVLSTSNCVPIITLTWLWQQAPPIYLGKTTQNFNPMRGAGAHSMILAAYDPDHQAVDGFTTPWGFINPWKTNASSLFWMTDGDFRKAWRFWLPGMGPNPMVLISRTSQS